ncbi:MAG TPA: NAD(P)H-quinone oxidoreductase [Rhizomicrobium sp.]|jgi:putative PIG3 family NAD(P)H quinone oxidoreductase|nr:NAD(P)H-quinone oxidoreductase [Rhizomicrobium sp.]
MRAIKIENPGPDYRLVLEETVRPEAGTGEVLIRVAAAGVNRADLLQSHGRYPPPEGASPILGMEVSGEIAACGADVTGFGPGEKVCALVAGGGYAEYCAAPVGSILPVPERVDVVDAAGLPEVHFTVWTNLMDSARLGPGESVLIHGGSSGIGTAAIQLCKALGNTVFATAGSVEKCNACEQLGVIRAINYREEDFVSVVERITRGKGVDVILDMVGGDYIERNLRALARGGRLVNIAFQKGTKAEVNFAPMLTKRLSFMATTLRGRSNAEKSRIRDAVRDHVWPLLADGQIGPIIDQVFPLAEAQAAHEKMQGGHHIGKILLRA